MSTRYGLAVTATEGLLLTDAQNSGPCGLQEVGGGRRIYAKTFAFLFLERLKIQTEQNRTAGNKRGNKEPLPNGCVQRVTMSEKPGCERLGFIQARLSTRPS